MLVDGVSFDLACTNTRKPGQFIYEAAQLEYETREVLCRRQISAANSFGFLCLDQFRFVSLSGTFLCVGRTGGKRSGPQANAWRGKNRWSARLMRAVAAVNWQRDRTRSPPHPPAHTLPGKNRQLSDEMTAETGV